MKNSSDNKNLISLPKLAKASKVTEKTLRYYHKIGLVEASEITEGGNKLYTYDDMLKLQSVLLYKMFGYKLKEIKKLIQRSNADMLKSLISQKKLLVEKRDEMDSILDTINDTINNINKGTRMTADELYKHFPDSKEYRDEAIERWGNEVLEMEVRLSKLDIKDIKAIKEEGLRVTKLVAECMDKPVYSVTTQEAIKLHYKYMLAFYEVPRERYIGLAQMYTEDERFTKYYEDIKPGLAEYISKAMIYYAENKL